MTSSESKRKSQRVLEELFARLSEERLQQEIDGPINKAWQEFSLPQAAPADANALHDVLVRFVQHMNASAPRLPRRTSAAAALGEAISLLEQHYGQRGSQGYHGALLDAMVAGVTGVEDLLECLAGAMKLMARQAYRQWVYVDAIDPLDWQLKCEVAASYVAWATDCLPPGLLDCKPERLADLIPDLIDAYMEADAYLRQAAGATLSLPA